MARNYELTFIARPEIDPASLTALIERVKGFITAENGTIVKVDQWGMRRLSYPINKIRDGQYVFMLVQLDAQAVMRVESRLKLVETVIRYLLVKAEDTKLAPAEELADNNAAETTEPAVEAAATPAPVAEAAPEAPATEAVATSNDNAQAQAAPVSE